MDDSTPRDRFGHDVAVSGLLTVPFAARGPYASSAHITVGLAAFQARLEWFSKRHGFDAGNVYRRWTLPARESD
jgi:hypothetical protein